MSVIWNYIWILEESMRQKKKKMSQRNIIEHLMSDLGSYVVGAMIKKDCNARSSLLKVRMVNSHGEPVHKT